MQRITQTLWQDSEGRDMFRLNPDGSVYVIPMSFRPGSLTEMIEALEDARDLVTESEAKEETHRILDTAVN